MLPCLSDCRAALTKQSSVARTVSGEQKVSALPVCGPPQGNIVTHCIDAMILNHDLQVQISEKISYLPKRKQQQQNAFFKKSYV